MIRTLAAAMATSTCIVALATPAAAQTREYNIPAGSLKSALDAYARQSGRQVVYRADEVRAARSPGARGPLSADAALAKLLAGSGFTTRADGNLIAIVKAGNGATTESASSSGGDVDESEIVVTGTNIRGSAPVGTRTTILSREDIAESGYQTSDKIFDAIPQNFRGGSAGASADTNLSPGSNSGYNTSFGSGINLRGLGNTATLVLVNSHRVPSSGSGLFTDISTIPVSAIDRIEVLTDGASAIYGSDAVAGVVNILLKRSSDGVEVGAQSAFADGFHRYEAYAQGGQVWSSGGFNIGIDLSRQTRLDTDERSFTSTIASPTTILPSYEQISIIGAFNQDIGENLEIHGDGSFVANRKVSFSQGTSRAIPNLHRWDFTIGGVYSLPSDWEVHYDLTLGRERLNRSTDTLANGAFAFYSDSHTMLRSTNHTLSATGSILELPGGPIQLAIGATSRTEGFDQTVVLTSRTSVSDVKRKVQAVYGELRLPIFGTENAIPLIQRLNLSAAVRYDHYSDFGGTTNPKVGISWYPVNDLELRAAYSTSFRAPATGIELANSVTGTTGVLVLGLTDQNGSQVPVVFLSGGSPNLKPERARNFTAGFTYRPSFVKRTEISFNYYNIHYRDRLASAPYLSDGLTNPAVSSVISYSDNPELQSIVANAIAGGAVYYDFTFGAFGADPLLVANTIYDLRTTNLSDVRTSGIDASIDHREMIGEDEVRASFSATYILKYDTRITPTSTAVSEINSVGNPSDFRFRATAGWKHRNLDLTVAANYVDEYPDNSSTVDRQVASYLTADVNLQVGLFQDKAGHNVTLALSALNIFDRKPPYVTAGSPSVFPDSHYDPANADAVGRQLQVALRAKW